MSERIELQIHGLVQGVYYRASAAAVARELELTGWVRNEEDGTVRLVAEGPRQSLERLVTWCRGGPPEATVDRVLETWSGGKGEFADFQIRH